MKETAVDKLVGEILTEVDKYNEDGDVIGIELWNAYKSCVDLSEFVKQANELFKEQIIKAYNESFLLRDKPYATAEKYYNETYENTVKQQLPQFELGEGVINKISFDVTDEHIQNIHKSLAENSEIAIVFMDKDRNYTQLKNENND